MATALEVVGHVSRKKLNSPDPSRWSESRLSWDCSDVFDELDDIFNKDSLQSSASDSALLDTRFETEFRKLTSRSNSTSTPFCNRISDSASQRLKSDSGVNDLNVAQIFANFCTLKTMENKCSTLSQDFVKLSRRDLKLNEELLPLPKIKLLAEFDAESTDGDSALGDSIHSDISILGRSDHVDSCKSNHRTFDLSETPENGIVVSPQKSKRKDVKHSEILRSVLQKFSPPNPDNIIGRKMGLDKVDILSELSYQSLPCVSTILSYVEEKDLCSLCQVSISWKAICDSDKKSTLRMNSFLARRSKDQNGKENTIRKLFKTPKTSKVHKSFTSSTKGPLGALQSSSITQNSSHTAEETKKNLFWKEGQKLKNDESLCKCPKCQSPSKVHKVQERAWCQNKNCGYDFCVKCLDPFHGARLCGQMSSKRSRTKETIAGTRKSKQRLKRL